MQKQIFIDQLGRKVTINYPPKKIISLVPSQTELLFDLGLNDEIAGITKFCIHPKEKVKGKLKIGGTKNLNLAAIKALQPDLIIGNKEENKQSDIEELMQHFPVWMSDIYNLSDAKNMIAAIGDITAKQTEADNLLKNIEKQFSELSTLKKGTLKHKKVAYFIWQKPFLLAGKNTFINEMLGYCGLENAVNLTRYPQYDLEQLKQLEPDVVFLSSEPYPFKEKHVKEFHTIWPKASIKIVDGEMFSWYGSRLNFAPAYFSHLITELF